MSFLDTDMCSGVRWFLKQCDMSRGSTEDKGDMRRAPSMGVYIGTMLRQQYVIDWNTRRKKNAISNVLKAVSRGVTFSSNCAMLNEFISTATCSAVAPLLRLVSL